ncbi:MAG: chromosome segregation protein SMC [Bacillota bacterium]
MFLKKIEIKGFKSFAQKTTISFESPLTAIVGPNGSGKSNIVDAVRWVLGEQSAKTLRGSRMSDIIFAGSEDKKALNKASVTLYLNNKDRVLDIDKDEVRIGRKVNNEGESDYLLNGSVCRLKDIKDLILDTGLGNDTYSIIGQGKIDSIINSRPEKLRELFEEAAGISKHKVRKEEAERRLEKTNKNLNRVEDLISELEKQVKSMKNSAEKAEKYKRIYNELKEIETTYLMNRWNENREKLSNNKKERTDIEKRIKIKEKEKNRISNTVQNKREVVENIQNDYEEKRETFHKMKAKIEEINNNLKILDERKRNLKREKNNQKKRIENLNHELDELENKKYEIKDKIKKIERNYNKIEKEVESKKELFNKRKNIVENKKEKINKLRNNLLDENGELRNLDRENEKLKEKIKSTENKIIEMKEEKRSLTEELNKLKNKVNKLSNKKDNILDKLEKKNILIEKRKKEKEEISEKLDELTEDYNDKKNEISSKNSKLEFLEDMENNYNGYYQGVKNILKEKNNFKGIRGVIADLIDTNKKYEKAIETSLGAKLQNIVVSNDKIAKKCIKFLKKNKKGRATFLPLNMVKGNKYYLDEKIRKMTGFLGLASELISYDSDLKNVMENLLGRVIIANNMDNAVEISKEMNSKIKIVTLSGNIVFPGGAMSGGSSSNNKNNLLGRSRKIDKLKKEVNKLKEEIEKISERGIKLKDKYKNIKEKIQDEKNNYHEIELKLNDIKSEITATQEYQVRLENQKENLNKKIKSSKKMTQKLKTEKSDIKDKLKLVNEGNYKKQDLIKDEEKELKIEEEKLEDIRNILTDKKVNLAEIKQNKEAITNEKEDITKRIEKTINKKSESETRIKEIKNKLEELKNKKNNLENDNIEFTKKADKLKNKYKNLEDKLKKERKALKDYEEKLESIQQKLSKSKDKSHKLELQITKLNNKLDRIKERLNEEYDISVKEELDYNLDSKKLKNAKEKISELKRTLKKLEPVNLGAVEEYEELKDRLEYLRDQSEDLRKAKKSIVEVITDIEETMGELFHKTFLEVKERFENIFQKLFGGGFAELILVNKDDLLNTGVEINAQPPGKKLKKLSLLSGGERALTAIALVFAFLQVNPSPFYILDEIDAPLDDANVARFADYLQEYSNIAQFVLVTHSKQMMTEVDTIYGVTMEESGISKLISLRLNEEEILV